MSKKLRTILPVGVIVVLTISVPLTFQFFPLRLYLNVLEGFWGYVALALIALATNATLLVPTPAVVPWVIEIAEKNSLFGAITVYAFFSAWGESTGYLLGRFGNKIPLVRESRFQKRLEHWMQGRRRTGLVLFVLAITPLPFDVGGVIAGNGGYPWRWFWIVTFVGRWLKYFWVFWAWKSIEHLLSKVPVIGHAAGGFMVGGLLILFVVIVRWHAISGFFKRRFKGRSKSSPQT